MAKKRTRQEMKKVFFIRRVVALVVLLLILVLIVRGCSKKDKVDEEIQTNNPAIQTGPIVVDGNTPDTNPDENTEVNTDEETGMVEEAINTHKAQIQEEYKDVADVTYTELDNTFTFELIDEQKESISRLIEGNGDDNDQQRWDDFKNELITLSETLTESVTPDIKVQVANPTDGGNILLIKDGSVIMDVLEN